MYGRVRSSRRAWHTSLRRVIAATLLLFLGVFRIEELIPDICDGDAPAAEVLAFAGNASDLTASELASARAALDAQATDPAGDESGSPPGPHSSHACHCVHAHGGALVAAADAALRPSELAQEPRSSRAAGPASMTYQPPQRPPLA